MLLNVKRKVTFYIVPIFLDFLFFQDRCKQYWPNNFGKVERIDGFKISLLDVEQFSDHVVRKMMIRKV